jgi:hypothetical protein
MPVKLMKLKLYIFICIMALISLAFFIQDEKNVPNKIIVNNVSKITAIIPENNNEKDEKVSVLESCFNKENMNVSLAENMNVSLAENIVKKKDIIKELIQHDLNNYSRKLIDSVLINSGIGLYKGHRFLRNNELTNVIHLTNIRNISFINSSQQKDIMEFVEKDDLAGFVDLYSNKKISTEKMLLLEGVAYTPLQIVLSFFKNNKKDYMMVVESIRKLIDSGVKVQFKDLVAYTIEDVSIEIMYVLFNNFSKDTNKTFFYEEQVHSLVTISVKKSALNSLNFWLSENISPTPLKYRDNAMDYVVSMNNNNQLEEVILLLMEYGVSPNSLSTSKFIEMNLTDEFKATNKHNLALHLNNKLNFEEANIRDEAVSRIFKIAMRNIKFNKNCTISTKHKQKNVKYIIDLEYSSKRIKKKNNIIQPKTFNTAVSNETFGENYSFENEKTDKDKNEKKDRQIKWMKNGDWKKVLNEELLTNDITDKEKLDVSFVLALMAGANSEELIELIEKGAEINPNLIRLIIKKCELKVLKSLYKYGYDFHYIYPDGSNSISVSVIYGKLDILKFLIYLGVSISDKDDPLDIAIEQLRFDFITFSKVIDTLLSAGVNVTELHRKHVAYYATSDFDLYIKFINKQPEFK